jgi:ABC-type phosphate/phosphonate transport system substrate-binding protein
VIKYLKIILLLTMCCLLIGGQVKESSHHKDVIRVGYSPEFFSGVDKKDVLIALDMWVKELVKIKNLNMKHETKIFDSFDEILQVIKEQGVDYVALSFLDYLKMKEKVHIEPVVLGTNNGKVGEEYVLIIHKNAPWADLRQLRGKKFLVQANFGAGSTSLFWLDTLLLKQHLSPSQNFFQSVKRVDKSSQAILPVLFRQADVCLVPRWAYDTMVELNPQVGQETTILAQSPALVRGALFIQKNIAPHKRILIDTFLQTARLPRAKQLMTLFQSEDLVPFHPSHLHTITALYAEHAALAKKYRGFAQNTR